VFGARPPARDGASGWLRCRPDGGQSGAIACIEPAERPFHDGEQITLA
jgi:hypothetical protein